MATPTAAAPIAERTDIHKSCKSLESILNVLNEYCEAVGVVVALQKKLAKALREAVGLKATGEIAANALAGSATVFEALFEVDTKYTKFADKEYDAVGAEVKRWFKKLVKEERAHDQKLEKANARIKQAGQNFEKKSKKNASDAADEHARYINLISTLGPEISQEKYNHALSVTQRHSATTASVASCIARIADAEWLRACEDVRLLAPNIGTLTQWRMLCEGGWTEPLPHGLPDGQDTVSSTNTRTSSPDIPDSMGPLPHDNEVQAAPDQQQHQHNLSARVSPVQQRYPLPSPHISPNVSNQNLIEPHQRQAAPSSRISPNVSSQNLTQHNSPAPTERPPPPSAFDTLKPPFFDPATGSVRTLSAFPAPPTHFPIPPVRQQTQTSVLSVSPSNATPSTIPPFTESPISTSRELASQSDRASVPSSDHTSSKKPSSSSSPDQQYRDYRHVQEERSPSLELNRPRPTRATTASLQPVPIEGEYDSPDTNRRHPASVSPREAHQPQREPSEFGEQRGPALKAHSYDALRRGVDRADSVISNGSLVAAMRDRYSTNPDSSSLALQRDPPRIPTKVTDLTARYQSPGSPSSSRPTTSSPTGRLQPSESPSSSRPRAASPPVQRQLSFPMGSKPDSSRPSHRGSNSISTSTPTIEEDAIRRRRQESDFDHRERELRERERELESRARELDRERAQLMTVHEGRTDGSQRPPISPFNRPRRISLRKQVQRPPSQMSVDEPSESPRQQRSPFSASPVPGRYAGDEGYRPSEEREREHAPYCGCHSCSVSKYAAPSPVQRDGGNALRPPSSPDKPKGGWMRRLSMPGGLSQAFSGDGKRNSSGYALGSGVSSATLAQQQKKGILSFDGRKNASATNLLRPPSEQGGGRRSLEGDRRRQ